MRIGIDIDNTICNTNEFIEMYQNKFIQKEKISKDILWNDLNCRYRFLSTYLDKIYEEVTLKEDAAKVINKLSVDNEIYIITARSDFFIDNINDKIEKYLKDKEIKYNIIITNAGDKVDACIENKIDIMIEDNPYNYNKLRQNNINTLLFDDQDANPMIESRVTSWKEIESYFRKNCNNLLKK